jgi:hypothetical protein
MFLDFCFHDFYLTFIKKFHVSLNSCIYISLMQLNKRILERERERESEYEGIHIYYKHIRIEKFKVIDICIYILRM